MIAKTPQKMAGIRLLTVILAAVMVLSAAAAVVAWLIPGSTANGGGIRPLEGNLISNRDQYLDSSVMYKLPETVKETDEISVIVEVKEKSLLEQYPGASSGMTFTRRRVSGFMVVSHIISGSFSPRPLLRLMVHLASPISARMPAFSLSE